MFGITQYFSSSSLWEAIDDVTQGTKAARMPKPALLPPDMSQLLQGVVQGVVEDPLSNATMRNLQMAWSHIRGMERFDQLSVMETRVRRILIMFGSWATYRWLIQTVQQ